MSTWISRALFSLVGHPVSMMSRHHPAIRLFYRAACHSWVSVMVCSCLRTSLVGMLPSGMGNVSTVPRLSRYWLAGAIHRHSVFSRALLFPLHRLLPVITCPPDRVRTGCNWHRQSLMLLHRCASLC